MRARFLLSAAVVLTLILPAASSAEPVHQVSRGESLSSIAAADGLSVGQLAAANGLSASAELLAGGTLVIPARGVGVVSLGTPAGSGDGDNDADDVGVSASIASHSAPTPTVSGEYIVRPGDTLSGIAARAGIGVGTLAAMNGLNSNGLLLSGTLLRVSGAAGGASAAASQPVGVAAQGSAVGPPYPTPERVTSSQVGGIAVANGVPASLADAIAWQESGFNNDLVSSADARGVMQILPGTWDWIQRTLTTGIPLAPASALSNVRGGVLLLHSLLDSTGGSPAMAAAGYYQGLPSVQQNGLYPSTQQYVGDVMALARSFGG